MPRAKATIAECEKQRMRDEIDQHIADYLRQGGKIDVLRDEHRRDAAKLGSVWHAQDDIASFT